MNEYRDSMFFRRCIDGAGDVFEGLRFERCQFDNCTFSNIDQVVLRAIARDLRLSNCEVIHSDLGPAILEDVIVENLKTHDLPICWGTLFKHVVVRGEIGRIKINKAIGVSQHPDAQRAFDQDRERFYRTIDWALDLSEARFAELSIRGVPARLVRIDSESQGFVTRESALQEGWRQRIRSRDDFWVFCIDLFLQEDDDDAVFVVPKGAPKQEYRDLLDGLNELKDLGVVLNQV